MKSSSWRSVAPLSFVAAFAVVLGGCGQSENKGGQAKDSGPAPKSIQVAQNNKKPHDHSGWWCDEHGVPEAECSQCLPDAEVKKRFKDKGDWCDKHERAMSQCFLCNPKAKEKYAALYRAKYGKEPPPTAEDEKAKDGDKKK